MSAKISKLLMAMALLSPFGSIASMAQGHFDGPKNAQEPKHKATRSQHQSLTAC